MAPRESSSAKAYGIQLYGFLVKTCRQRLRSPISTFSTIFIPFIFILLLGVCYWASDAVHTPEKWYSVGQGGITNTTFNISTISESFFCKHPASALNLVWSTCTFPPMMLTCMDNVGTGADLCIPTPMVSGYSGFLNSMYYYSGALTLNPMDSHLSISAFTQWERDNTDPTFFGRNGRESITHFGELLVASEDPGVATAFMEYCKTQSGMCSAVLNSHIFSSLDEAEKYALDHSDAVWAVLHLPSDLLTSEEDEVLFTIRMNYSATPWTFRDKVENLFSPPSAGSAPYILYWTSGFMTLQQFVQQFVLEQQLADKADLLRGPATYSSGTQGMSPFLNRWNAAVTPMPTPETTTNAFLSTWGYYLPLICALAALFPAAHLTALVVEEKSCGVREAMLIMGMHHTCMFSGWYVTSLLLDAIAALLVSMIFKLGFLSNVSYSVLFVLYFSFQQQNTALSLLISSLFSNPRIAGWCAALTIFVFAMPYYTFPPGMRDSAYWGASTVPCVGFAVSIGKLTSYVNVESEVGWHMARYGQFSVVDAIGMMWVSFAVMVLLALYLDRVWPAAVGRREHPLFFLRYLCCCCRKTVDPEPIALYDDTDDEATSQEEEATSPFAEATERSEDEGAGLVAGPGAGRRGRTWNKELIEHRDEVVDPTDESVPVIFKNVTMVYISGSLLGFLYTLFTGLFRAGDYCVALRRVSFALHRGEVSTLLGPNGSGKTTIMNLATTMRTPSSGQVYIAGHNANEDLTGCRRHIGYCPQENIVWEDLSVEEHLTFYARLKGADSIDVSEAVERALEMTGLVENRGRQAGTLSGGEQRRLCVGIALVGDSKVLFLDEPTAGLDVQGRREVYRVIQRAREGRSVLISTHLLDEADRLGDRLLILHNGKLCGEGSSMYLKAQTNAGYKLTCVMESGMPEEEEEAAVGRLVDFVRERGAPVHEHIREESAIQVVPPGCQLLGMERRGREVTFMFPLSFLSAAGKPMLEQLEASCGELRMRSVGISLTTLEDVFKATLLRQLGGPGAESRRLIDTAAAATRTAPGTCPYAAQAAAVCPFTGPPVAGTMVMPDTTKADAFGINKEENYEPASCLRFFRDFRALFLKRLHYAKRDGKLVFFQVVLPVLFLAVALLINLAQAPMQPAITLDMSLYADYKSNPSEVLVTRASMVPRANADAFAVASDLDNAALGSYYIAQVHDPAAGPPTISGVPQMNSLLSGAYYTHTSPRYIALSTTNFLVQSGPPHDTAVVLHNATYAHAAPQAINALYALALSQIFGSTHVAKPVVRNAPLPLGPFEKELVDANKQVMMGMFVILAFILIPANTISYIVNEKATGARHLQWLTGTSMLAYWCSSFVFDLLCYIGTILLAYVIFFVFHRSEYTGPDMIGPAITLFLFFGISSIPFSYVLSFFFRSPFRAQNFVLIINFVFGFLWVTCESLLGDSAFQFVMWATRILRVLPCVPFGEGLYVLAGTKMGTLMYPTTERSSLFGLLHFDESGRSIFKGGVGTGLIYMGCVTLVSTALLVVLEYVRVHHWTCCSRRSSDKSDAGTALTDTPDAVLPDLSVAEEEERVCSNETGPKEDCIAVQHLHKKYWLASSPAVRDVSIGVRRGEVLALLGLNGAGKTSTLSVLCGERAATSGAVFMNHEPISSDRCRHFIGYCPQFDALLEKLTPEEHLYLFARLRGMREEMIQREVGRLIRELGLYPHRHQTAEALSGGNRRRLSLALALVGHTTSVLLDEPTAGMDAYARAQTCAAVKSLTRDKSVILTTHLLEETEALADRVAILSSGRLRTIGTAQEVQQRYDGGVRKAKKEEEGKGEERVHMLRVHFAGSAVLGETLLGRVQAYLEASLGEGSCAVDEVIGSGVKFVVRHNSVSDLCDVVMALTGSAVEGIPAVAYVGLAPPSMEDVLLAS